MSMSRCGVVLAARRWVGFNWVPGMFCLAMVLVPVARAHAAFSSYLPLSLSGSVSYGYGYVHSGESASETTNLTGTLNVAGYIWQPWFATTSAALNLGLSNTETTTSSSDSTVTSGSLSFNVFPMSRFPFSMTYARTDSRSQSFQDLTQASGGADHRTTRLSLRQTYRGRRGSVSNLWFYKTRFESESTASGSKSYGGMYQASRAYNSISASLSHAETESSDTSDTPKTDVASVTHTYTPSNELGVSNLVSYVNSASDSGGGKREVTSSQAASSFFWRPEHRAFSISGGVRISEIDSDSGKGISRQKSLNTNVGASYRLTRSLNVGAAIAVGSADSDGLQTVTTSQAVNISYASMRYLIAGFDYTWQASANASNSTTRTDTMDGGQTTSDIQNLGGGIGHNASKSWRLGQTSSLGLGLSQSFSESKSSTEDVVAKTLNQGASMSWSHRGKSGSTYASVHASDARNRGKRDSNFQQLGVNLSQDMTINRLSSLGASANYQANRLEQEGLDGSTTTQTIRTVSGSMGYNHNRPFGVYNLRFSSQLMGSKQIDANQPTTQWDWDNRFTYSLGLLNASLSLRIIDNAAGSRTTSLYFRATRSF
jgi:hypothetical protein